MIRLSGTTMAIVGTVVVILVGVVLYLVFDSSKKRDNYNSAAGRLQLAAPVINVSSLKPNSTPTLALFHATWCPHCVNMLNDWKQAQNMLQGKVATVSIESKDPEMSKHQIKGFPTLRFFPQGLSNSNNFTEFNGRTPKTAESIVDFAMFNGNH